ncbi:MAG: hypothetical protein JNK02_00655 [Planctomycetes bacterium]|nr:hypothetical protein [Planctomycetota bacterium]
MEATHSAQQLTAQGTTLTRRGSAAGLRPAASSKCEDGPSAARHVDGAVRCTGLSAQGLKAGTRRCHADEKLLDAGTFRLSRRVGGWRTGNARGALQRTQTFPG